MSRCTFRELVDAGVLMFSDGYRTKRSELADQGFRILRVADVGDGLVSLDGADFVSEERQNAIGAKQARQGDLLLTTKGSIGRVAVVPNLGTEKVAYSPQLCFFRLSQDGPLMADYLRYWFKSDEAQRQIAMYAGNTDMAPYLSLRDIAALEVDLPPLHTQRAIAEVLGALDDKIAANRAIVTSVLELIDALYSQVPKLERQASFECVAELGGGGTPSTKVEEYWGGEISWATPSDITRLNGAWLGDTNRTLTPEGLKKSTSKLYPTGSIFMTSRASIGFCAMAAQPTAVNQGFIALNAHENSLQPWFFAQLRSRKAEWESWSNGATFMELPRGVFRKLHADLGSAQDMADFATTATPLLDRSRTAENEITRLTRTRNELLPALMSGRITVKDAESRVEEEV